MKSEIKSVSEYMFLGWKYFDVRYDSGRTFAYIAGKLPNGARQFIAGSTRQTKVIDTLHGHGEVIIYEA